MGEDVGFMVGGLGIGYRLTHRCSGIRDGSRPASKGHKLLTVDGSESIPGLEATTE